MINLPLAYNACQTLVFDKFIGYHGYATCQVKFIIDDIVSWFLSLLCFRLVPGTNTICGYAVGADC